MNIDLGILSQIKSAPSAMQRAQTAAVGEKAGIVFYRFQGRPIKTTRPWCRAREGHVFHIEEIREWGRQAASGDGWDGMVEGTNEQTIMTYLGGWYGDRSACRHVLIPVLPSRVPEEDMARMRAKGLLASDLSKSGVPSAEVIKQDVDDSLELLGSFDDRALRDMMFGSALQNRGGAEVRVTPAGELGRRYGYDAKPETSSGWRNGDDIFLYRGISGQNARKFKEEFINGDLFDGRGSMGNGTYFASERNVAESYASGGSIIGASARSSNLKSIDSDELIRIKTKLESEYLSLSRLKADARAKLGPNASNDAVLEQAEKFEAARRVLFGDMGALATSLGYDAISPGNFGGGIWVILNRGKLTVNTQIE